MFNDLYDYVPIPWLFYISKEKIDKVITVLNKYNKDDVFPKKEYIFNGFSPSPDNIKLIIFGEIYNAKYNIGIPYGINSNDIMTNNLQNIFDEIKYEYNDFPNDLSLSYLIKQNTLLLNFPLTCLSKQKNAHMKLWEEIISEMIIKLIYNSSINNHILILVTLTLSSINFCKKIITDWIPEKDINYYYSPSYKNIFLMIFNNPNKTVNDKFLSPFYKSNCFIKINNLLKKYNEKEINWLK